MSPIAPRAEGDARHSVRPELVHLLRDPSGTTVASRVGRGDDIARAADLLRPAGHGSVRSGHAGRAADLGAMGRQHHRGVGRSRKSRSGPHRVRRRVRGSGVVRGDTSVADDRTGRAGGLCGYRDATRGARSEEVLNAMVAMWGTGEYEHLLNPDMPWNEEIRATWARMERLAASPRTLALMMPLTAEMDVRAVLPTIRVPTLVVQHADDPLITPAMGKYVADHISGAKYVELPGRNLYHFVEPWRRVLPRDRRVPHRPPCRRRR